MKSDGELMEILNAYDLTGSYRAAAELCGCSHHTVKKAVTDRAAGLPPAVRRARMIDDWQDVLEGWVADSRGKIRGDKAHERLQALGFTGLYRFRCWVFPAQQPARVDGGRGSVSAVVG